MSDSPIMPRERTIPVASLMGILALQGDFAAHASIFEQLGIPVREVRTADDLTECKALVIPGGESTTIGKLLVRYGLLEPLRERIRTGMPVFGTCAGMILLSSQIASGAASEGQTLLGALDIAVDRNAYGRQVDSFEADIPVVLPTGDVLVRGLFIRAPGVSRVGRSVEVMGSYEGKPVLVRDGNVVAASFHPELVGETRLHAWFASLASPVPGGSVHA